MIYVLKQVVSIMRKKFKKKKKNNNSGLNGNDTITVYY